MVEVTWHLFKTWGRLYLSHRSDIEREPRKAPLFPKLAPFRPRGQPDLACYGRTDDSKSLGLDPRYSVHLFCQRDAGIEMGCRGSRNYANHLAPHPCHAAMKRENSSTTYFMLFDLAGRPSQILPAIRFKVACAVQVS